MRFATWVKPEASALYHQLERLADQPSVVSFLGGKPISYGAHLDSLRDAFGQSLQGPADQQSLNQVLRDRAKRIGIDVHPDDITVTHGLNQALDLLAKCLLRPGDAILVESPTDPQVLSTLASYHPLIISLPAGQEGLSPKRMEAYIQRYQPKFVLLSSEPSLTGGVPNKERRSQVHHVCRSRDVLVVEIQSSLDSALPQHRATPLRASDDHSVYIQSWSCAVAADLNLAWMVAPAALLPALRMALAMTTGPVHPMVQRAAVQWLVHHETAVLDEIRLINLRRLARLQAEVSSLLPGCESVRPSCTDTLWVSLPQGVRSIDLTLYAMDQAVVVLPEDACTTDGCIEQRIRFNIASVHEGQIHEGIERLAVALERLQVDVAEQDSEATVAATLSMGVAR